MSDQGGELSDVTREPGGRSGFAALVALLFAAVVLATVFCAHRSTRLEDDQNKFNLPTIRQFARQLPWPNISSYSTATAPGYHLVLAVVARVAGDSATVLRLAGAVFGVLLIFTVARETGRQGWLVLPLVFSTYVVTSAGWLLPEDAAWWLAAMAIVVALRWKIDDRFFLVSALLMLALVFTRQSAVWIVAPVCIAAWVGEGGISRPRRLLWLAGSIAPAFLMLGLLVSLWHGLTPPTFQATSATTDPAITQYGGVSAGSALMTLAMIGLFGTPLIGWFWRPRNGGWTALCIGGATGLAIAAICPSSPVFPTRRSGLWSLAGHLPIVGGRSLLMIALAALGGTVATLAISAQPRRAAWVMGSLLIAFVAVQATNPFLWQRYYEPFALLWLIFAAAHSTARSPRWGRWTGLAVLSAIQIAALIYFIFFSAVE